MSPEDQLKTKFEQQDDAALQKAVYALLHSADGRTFLWWLINDVCGFGQDIAQGDTNFTLRESGRQSVLWRLLNEITFRDPEGYVLMQQEKLNEHRARDLELRSERERRERNYNRKHDDGDDGEQRELNLDEGS